MEWVTWVTIVALVVGPFLGIWANGKLENRKITYQRKLDIFKTLMATRATPLAREHVEALNRIDIEFTGRREKEVREAWAELLDHYGQAPTPPTPPLPNQNHETQTKYQTDLQDYNSRNNIWSDKIIELRSTLLHEMGKLFNYNFDIVKIRKAVYYPKLHGDIEQEQMLLLMSANSVFLGQRPLYVSAWGGSDNPAGE